jgi:hypothetical protein
MYFYEVGTLNPKDTYADEEALTSNSNPVVLSAGGLEPNIFLDGAYRVILKDSSGVQIWDRDNVNTTPLSPFQQWLPTISYPDKWPVIGSDGYYYVSQQNNNIGNDPTSSPTEWFLFAKQIGFDDANNGYVYVVDTAEPLKINAVSKNTIRSLVPITTVTASNVATVDFTGITSAYDYYIVEVVKCSPATDGVNFLFRTSSDNGVAFDSGASDYSYGVAFSQTPAGVTSRTGSAATTEIVLSGGAVGNDANQEYISLNMHVLKPAQVAYGTVYWDGASNAQTTGNYVIFQGTGQRRAEAAFNAIRFFFSSGNIAEGIFTLYGVRTA